MHTFESMSPLIYSLEIIIQREKGVHTSVSSPAILLMSLKNATSQATDIAANYSMVNVDNTFLLEAFNLIFFLCTFSLAILEC